MSATSGRLTSRLRAAVVVTAASLAAACKPEAPASRVSSFAEFTDVAGAVGVVFVHDNGFDGASYRVAETVNGGVALLDYDADGWLDVYFTNAVKRDPGTPAPRNALFRNRGDGTFTDVSAASRTDDAAFSFGCTVADIDGDDFPEVYVTNLGANRLYRQDGDGVFRDIAPQAGVAGDSMDTGSVFFDFDEDGDLDLYVASYVDAGDEKDGPLMVRGVPSYWPPLNYVAAADHLYENVGDGRFRDVSKSAGILDVEPGRGLGVVAADFNHDGHADLYVANDMSANFMFIGDGHGRFTEVGFLNGTALSDSGEVLGSMGVDVADVDGNGHLDICVTNYQNQFNNFYLCQGSDIYLEAVQSAGISRRNLTEVSWGVGAVDLDNDGRRDLVVINGHLNPQARRMDQSTDYPQRKRLFRNRGAGRFEDVSDDAGAVFAKPRVGRGAAFGDLDNDGDLDIVVVNNDGPAEILRNDCRSPGAWALVRLVGSGKNRSAIGARVTLRAGEHTLVAERLSAASYLSANDPRLHFGLAAATKIDRLHVRWPGGAEEFHDDLPVNRVVDVVRNGKIAIRPGK